MTLNKNQRNKLNCIGKKYNLKLILLHGSYVEGLAHVGSDLDIAILGKNETNLKQLLDIHSESAKVFGNSQDRELDVKTLNKANPLFLYQVLSKSRLLFGNSEDYQELRAYGLKLYLDSKNLFSLEKKMVEKYQKYLNSKDV